MCERAAELRLVCSIFIHVRQKFFVMLQPRRRRVRESEHGWGLQQQQQQRTSVCIGCKHQPQHQHTTQQQAHRIAHLQSDISEISQFALHFVSLTLSLSLCLISSVCTHHHSRPTRLLSDMMPRCPDAHTEEASASKRETTRENVKLAAKNRRSSFIALSHCNVHSPPPPLCRSFLYDFSLSTCSNFLKVLQ